MTITREVTWGEALVVAAFRSPRGLTGAVDAIQAVAGAHIGTRNTFAKLFKTDDPSELRTRDEYRAWLLIVALGEDPSSWGIGDDVVPAGYDLGRLRRGLESYGSEGWGFESLRARPALSLVSPRADDHASVVALFPAHPGVAA